LETDFLKKMANGFLAEKWSEGDLGLNLRASIFSPISFP
jgi:hypothetical protein